MQMTLVALALLASVAYLARALSRSLSGRCGGCGGGKKAAATPLIVESELTARIRGEIVQRG
jgi:hypothetical protein